MNLSLNSVKRNTSFGFIFLILLVAFSNVFVLSGFANSIHFSDRLSELSLIGMLWFACKRKPAILSRIWYGLCVVSILTMVILSVLNYNAKAMQLCNLVTTFGIVYWVQLFSRLEWERKDLFKLGFVVSLLAMLLSYLFLPGHAWSNWNPNSSISVVPILLFGLACVWCSDFKLAHLLTIPIVLVYILIISTLENRTSFYGITLFCLLVLTRFAVLHKKWYRIVYISIILLNVMVPFLANVIAESNIFDEILGMSSVGAEKAGGFNGRESLWEYAIMLNAENPFFGLYGVRPLYPHNFSMDLLVEYGWMGWLTFYGMVIAIMEKVFRENSKYNIFAIAFVSIIFMNTFENVFSCCNVFVVFSYMLPAVVLCIHRSGCYETNGYNLLK